MAEGVSFISVSLDGASPHTHEYLRNVSGSYAAAVNGIKALVEVGFPVQIICTLHRGNLAEMEDVVVLAGKLGCTSVKFNLVQKVGRGERFGDDQGLEVAEILSLYTHIEENVVPRHQVSILFDIPIAFHPIRRLLVDKGRCTVLNILGVLASGELSLCGIGVTTPDLIYGHIEHDSLYDIWCSSPGLKQLREQVPAQLEGICAQCVHQALCKGDCVAHTYYRTHQLCSPHQFCEEAETLGFFPASRKIQGSPEKL
jgi:SynChlorMet cassette radical SAM/SPASM protein ScmF